MDHDDLAEELDDIAVLRQLEGTVQDDDVAENPIDRCWRQQRKIETKLTEDSRRAQSSLVPF
ncbi:MAG: hypothetical protein ABW110_22090 [Steroidobacteraceae bacterium]